LSWSGVRSRILQRLGAAGLVTLADIKHARAAQACLRRDLVIGAARLAKPDHLNAPLVPRFARQ
jgi:hypothetical protein